jgi:hypothetical protein
MATTYPIFEVVGSYVLGVFLNGVYFQAKQGLKPNPPEEVLKKAYIDTLTAYVGAVKSNDDAISDVLAKILEEARISSLFSAISMSTLVNLLVTPCVPKANLPALPLEARTGLAKTLVISLHVELHKVMLQPDIMAAFVVRRDMKSNVTALQNKATQLLDNQREHYYMTFAKHIVGGNRPTALTDNERAEIQQHLLELKDANAALLQKVKELTDEVGVLTVRLSHANQRNKVMEDMLESIAAAAATQPAITQPPVAMQPAITQPPVAMQPAITQPPVAQSAAAHVDQFVNPFAPPSVLGIGIENPDAARPPARATGKRGFVQEEIDDDE